MSNELSIFESAKMDSLIRFAELMAGSSVAIPSHLVGKPADCMAIAMQAMQWDMNPYAVAQATYLVSGKLGYEAKLVNAVIGSSKTTEGRFKYEYGGSWENLAGKVAAGKSVNNKPQAQAAWTPQDEVGLWCRVGAILKGDTEITWGEPVYLASVLVRNSPLWVTAPKQQIAYLALKYWARLYTPDVLLGVYDKEELEEPNLNNRPIDVNPRPDLKSAVSGSDSQIHEAEFVAPKEPDIEPKNDGGEFVPSEYDLIIEALEGASNKAAYQEVHKMFTYAKEHKTMSEKELKKVAIKLNELFQELS